MSKAITQFMPKEEEKAIVQGKVRKALRDEAENILHERKWTWVDFLEAALQAFIEENRRKK